MGELVTKTDMDLALSVVRQEMRSLSQQMTVRLGGMIAVAGAILAAIIKF